MQILKNTNIPFLHIYCPTAKQIVWALAVFSIAVAIFYWRVFDNLDTHLLGGSSLDAGLYYYLFKFNQTQFFDSWYNTDFFYPYRGTLAWSDNFILPALVSEPLKFLGFTDIARYNLTLLTAIGLNGLCTFVLAFSLCGLFWTSICTGLVVFSLSFINENSGHPQLLFFFWLPLGLYFIFKFIEDKKLTSILFSFLTLAFCFLTTVYYALFSGLLIVAVLGAVALLRPHWIDRQACVNFMIACLIGALAIIPFALPYFDSHTLFGARQLYEAFFLSANFSSFFQSSGTSWIYSSLANSQNMEAGLFIGLILPVIALFAIYRIVNVKSLRTVGVTSLLSFCAALVLSGSEKYIFRSLAATLLWLAIGCCLYFLHKFGKKERLLGFSDLSNRDILAIFLSAALIFASLSLGPLANSDWSEIAFSPFVLTYQIVPGFSGIRASYRFAFPALFCLVMTLPFIFPVIQKRVGRLGLLAIIVLSGLIILENWQTTYPLEELPKNQLPAAQSNRAMLVLPLQDSSKSHGELDPHSYAQYNVDAMLWSLPNRTLINGYSGRLPRLHQKLIASMVSFPDPSSLKYLASFANLKYIVYNGWRNALFNSETFEKQIQDSGQLRIISKSENASYLIEFQPETEIASEKTLFVPADPKKSLHLEFKGKVVKDGDPCEALISVVETPGINLLQRATLSESGEYSWFTISLSTIAASQKPLTISIVNSCSQPIWLRGRLLEEQS